MAEPALDAATLRGTRGVDLTVWPPRYDRAYRPGAAAEHWLPRTEFKARRVIDDRDLYRQGLQSGDSNHV